MACSVLGRYCGGYEYNFGPLFGGIAVNWGGIAGRIIADNKGTVQIGTHTTTVKPGYTGTKNLAFLLRYSQSSGKNRERHVMILELYF